jgi:hypothetical protein
MTQVSLTPEDLLQLRVMGWDYMPTSDVEWRWLKFDDKNKQIAVEGDETWIADCQSIK